MDLDNSTVFCDDFTVCKCFSTHPTHQVQVSCILNLTIFRPRFKDVDVVEVIKVLSIESSECHHTTANKSTCMSSPSLRNHSTSPEIFQGRTLRVNDNDVLEIIAESPSKNVNFTIKDHRSMPPTSQK